MKLFKHDISSTLQRTILLAILFVLIVSLTLQQNKIHLLSQELTIEKTENSDIKEQLRDYRATLQSMQISPTPIDISNWQARTYAPWNIEYNCPANWECKIADSKIYLYDKKYKANGIVITRFDNQSFKHPSFNTVIDWYNAFSKKDHRTIENPGYTTGDESPQPYYTSFDIEGAQRIFIGVKRNVRSGLLVNGNIVLVPTEKYLFNIKITGDISDKSKYGSLKDELLSWIILN